MIPFLLLLVGFALYVMKPEERARLVRAMLGFMGRVKTEATRPDPYRDALRERTRWVIVTPGLALLNAAIFILMLLGAGAFSDSATLVAWGGNLGPRTTNGEWWRVVTSMFVHTGMLSLLATLVGIGQLGRLLERLVGSIAFAAVYIASGIFASLVSITVRPVAVSVGASGAVFGLYGLLFASLTWALLNRSTTTIPFDALKKLGPAAAVFMLYNLLADNLPIDAEFGGFVTGFLCGLLLSHRVTEHTTPPRQVAMTMAAVAVLAVACCVPLRGIADVKPEIARVVAVEDRTATAYDTALRTFQNGRMTAEALAQLIDRSIVPELQAADIRLRALDRVPSEHQPLIADAEEYVRLRSESWRLRAEGLRQWIPPARGRAPDTIGRSRAEKQHTVKLLTLSRAEQTERASLSVLQRIKPGTPDAAVQR